MGKPLPLISLSFFAVARTLLSNCTLNRNTRTHATTRYAICSAHLLTARHRRKVHKFPSEGVSESRVNICPGPEAMQDTLMDRLSLTWLVSDFGAGMRN